MGAEVGQGLPGAESLSLPWCSCYVPGLLVLGMGTGRSTCSCSHTPSAYQEVGMWAMPAVMSKVEELASLFNSQVTTLCSV